MIPKVIVHNTISLDGGIEEFPLDMDLHYSTALGYEPEAIMAGSGTVNSAQVEIPPEDETDLKRQVTDPDDPRPYWVVVDSRGRLEGRLHFFRRMEYIRDIIVLVSSKTPKTYVSFLEDRRYPVVMTGEDHVDYREALEILWEKYKVRTLVIDTGPILIRHLLEAGLVNEISLIIAPFLVGNGIRSLFSAISIDGRTLDLQLMKCETMPTGEIHVIYSIAK